MTPRDSPCTVAGYAYPLKQTAPRRQPGGKSILDQITGEAPKEEPPPVKNAAAVALGRLGGKKGGVARAASLSPRKRKEIAKKAAAARWNKSPDNP